ncbi:hypothetical protein COT44_02550 [Candidatus Shapirobacteria bacterium CG08_land_8_20_14_0_20_39_18]|uniref:Transposase IS200-like domain-containing protein n=1 Tax=Candidatus Shapirobacteria bacterium CG08_land_8_20_14_0_20_39_18 TaxID=1974883 RepID=A0A2M6XD10_9BACT|nr:MAG: hypothetical protein COT44_02550 [Candidatus Shapirobacteria bacterium CG08_land_8_20_14_0_20_39_18]PIY65277.1 MAG: hypothetical protein COY91_02570 [Candidatus Shapirobacteria bacterium CG_4_10_14_0_8_um_filter_39_15]PJE68121.1 MAG: hypothetical protein COU94_03500 [Candidatus Shapirobacteria bacterium CG10_big_fil_rev_8_21_14_0_10_38_8]
MPYRFTPLVTGQFYHIFNRGIARQPVFLDKYDYQRMIDTLWFYHFAESSVKFSRYLTLPYKQKTSLINTLALSKDIVSINTHALMPNHFHLLLSQEKDGGISKFIKKVIDSYTRFFNTKYERNGAIFQGQFKAKLIESDEQLLHLSRYIHLNPYTSHIVNRLEDIINYPWSSMSEYMNIREGISNPKYILSNFGSKEKYLEFVNDQKNYQRILGDIKHLTFE